LGANTSLGVDIFTGPIFWDYTHLTCIGVNEIGVVTLPHEKTMMRNLI